MRQIYNRPTEPVKTVNLVEDIVGMLSFTLRLLTPVPTICGVPIYSGSTGNVFMRAAEQSEGSDYYKERVKRKIEEAEERLQWLRDAGKEILPEDVNRLEDIKANCEAFILGELDDINFSVFIDELDEIARESKLDEIIL